MDIPLPCIVGILIFVGLFVGLFESHSRMCPKCHALFARQKIYSTSLPEKDFLSLKKVRVNYMCRKCGHGWHGDYVDADEYRWQ